MSANHSNWLHVTPLHRFAAKGHRENAEIPDVTDTIIELALE
jgi:hypothetical protein